MVLSVGSGIRLPVVIFQIYQLTVMGCVRFNSLRTVLILRDRKSPRGTWVVQLAKCPTLDFSSGHDLTVREFEPRVGLCAGSVEPAWDYLSPSPSACASPSLSLKNK